MFVPGGNAFLGSQNQVVLGEQQSFPALFFLWWDLVIQTGHPLCYDEVFSFQIYDGIKEQRAHLERPTPCFFWSARTPTISSKVVLFLWNLSRWPLTHPLDYFRPAFFWSHPRARWVWKSHVPLLLNHLLWPSPRVPIFSKKVTTCCSFWLTLPLWTVITVLMGVVLA